MNKHLFPKLSRDQKAQGRWAIIKVVNISLAKIKNSDTWIWQKKVEKQQSYTLGSILGIYILAKIAALKIKQCYKTGKALTSTSYTRHRKWQHRYSTKFPDSGCKIWKKEVFYIYLHLTISGILYRSKFSFVLFSFCLKTSFHIFCDLYLLAMNFFSFSLSEEVFSLPSFL